MRIVILKLLSVEGSAKKRNLHDSFKVWMNLEVIADKIGRL